MSEETHAVRRYLRQAMDHKVQSCCTAGSITPDSHPPSLSGAEEGRGSPREQRPYPVLKVGSTSQPLWPGGSVQDSAEVSSRTQLYPCDLVSRNPSWFWFWIPSSRITILHMDWGTLRAKHCQMLGIHGLLPVSPPPWSQYCISSLQMRRRRLQCLSSLPKANSDRLIQEFKSMWTDSRAPAFSTVFLQTSKAEEGCQLI